MESLGLKGNSGDLIVQLQWERNGKESKKNLQGLHL